MQQKSTQTSRLVDNLLTGDRAELEGISCNDPSGLCLLSKGTMTSANNSGIYTTLVRLAAQLQTQQGNVEVPLISIETKSYSIMVKEYDGHAVAMKVPRTAANDETDE
ncbi:unnamed protein product [Cylindrotheca closterium]|uniref:Late endosomal/lysosomal adaptor and MAPK and MTOR activator 5 n=1 Tax=Cylindrotheca closterium TaxID=2856 RepID=A0AAD2FUH6_9STRA|nr:unnamed protein product [Cylindrotheca closterium]